MASQTEAAEALAQMGVKYKASLEQVERDRDLVKAAAIEADAAGISRLEIIRLSGMSRSASYALFREIEATKRSKQA